MKKTLSNFLIAPLSILLLTSNSMASTTQQTYKNQFGSTLTVQWNETEANAGTISGTFATAVASPHCKDVIGVPAPITGFYNGNAISFIVNYPSCHAILSMTGNFSSDKKTIQTLWLDAHQNTGKQGVDWSSNIIGSATFNKV